MPAAHPARSIRRSPNWLRIALALLVPSVLLVTAFAIATSHLRHSAAHASAQPLSANWQAAIDVSAPAESRRTIFPYSVIPGGVRDAKELAATVSKDRVVAAHYSDFKLSAAHTVRLDQPAAMYVSYRVANHIYWTRNRMVIPAGETLISDGENLARVRCGNRLSKIAALPVSVTEPPTEQLESPNFIPPLLADMLPGEGSEAFSGIATPPLPILPAVSGTGGRGSGDGGFPPILPPAIFPPAGAIVLPPPPPVATPEPGGLLLLAAGALFGAVIAFFRK